MMCSSCHATIADKAIVCYRCGAPTAIPAVERPERQAARRRRGPLFAIVLLLLTIVSGVVAATVNADSWIKLAAVVAAVVLGIATAATFFRRR